MQKRDSEEMPDSLMITHSLGNHVNPVVISSEGDALKDLNYLPLDLTHTLGPART